MAPRAGGPIDVVPPDAGFLYPPGDGLAMRRCVDALACDPDLRARMGVAARATVQDRSWVKVSGLLVCHCREVVAERTTWLGVA